MKSPEKMTGLIRRLKRRNEQSIDNAKEQGGKQEPLPGRNAGLDIVVSD